MIVKAIFELSMALFFRIGYLLYIHERRELRIAEIIVISGNTPEINKHYETIRNMRLGRVERRLSADTPITPFVSNVSNDGSVHHETRLLPQSRRPNKLKQTLWNLEVLEQYITFNEQILSTPKGKFQIHLFSKDVPPEDEWDKHISLSRFTNAAISTTRSMLGIYKILDNSVYRNIDLEMTMISLIKSARRQTDEIDTTETDQERSERVSTEFLRADKSKQKLINDRLEIQVETELKDQVEAEILMLVTVLHNDLDQILQAINLAKRLMISYHLVVIVNKLSWISKKESAKRLRTRIIPITKNLIFGKHN